MKTYRDELTANRVLRASVIQQARRARECHRKRTLLVFVGGGWSTGKSVHAIALASQLGLANVIQTDNLRCTLRVTLRGDSARCLSFSSYESWRCRSERFSERAMQEGFDAQCRVVYPAVRGCIEEAIEYGKDTMIEGIHLHPQIYGPLVTEFGGLFVWLTNRRALTHAALVRRCAYTYRGRRPERYLELSRHERISALNRYLHLSAEETGLPILDLFSLPGRRRMDDLLSAFFESW